MVEQKLKLVDFVTDNDAKNIPKIKKKISQCDILMELATEKTQLFCDEYNEAFAKVSMGDHFEIWPVSSRSKDFRNWLIVKYYREIGTIPSSSNVNNVIDTIRALAWENRQQYKLHIRSAWFQDCIFYDLANAMWQSIKIYPGGWQIINNPPILFRRYPHMKEQPLLDPQGDPKKLMEFINIEDEKQKLLYLCSIITDIIPDIPHVVKVLYGQEGSTKSTTSKITRSVIDPSAALTCRSYTQKKEFVQYLAHNYCCVLDNLSAINTNLSDLLCSAVTGDGDTKRTLYTDDGDTIFVFKRSFIINGINNVVLRPDLLRRSVLFELHPPKPNMRATESDLWRNFEASRSFILGGILNTLAKAMQIYPQLKLERLYDMADFTLWGAAVAEALGATAEAFLDAYESNKTLQMKQAILNNAVAHAVTVLMAEKSEWSGSPTRLLFELENIANKEKMDVKSKNWPKAANALMRKLNEVRTTLSRIGIEVTEKHMGNKGRMIILKKTHKYR